MADEGRVVTTEPRVRVVPYDADWPLAFEAERDALQMVLGPAATAIHHVGSTSVPGLSSKPIIDVLVETPSLESIDGATPRLREWGYDARGEYGIAERRYFSRPPGPGLKVHLHAFESGHWQIARHLHFRDYLLDNPEDAGRYGRLKESLAVTHAEDPEAYQAAKADLIAELQAKALEWGRA